MITTTCIEKLPCKDCKSSDSLQTYLNCDTDLDLEWVTSFCHGSCWSLKGDPYSSVIPKVHVKTKEEMEWEVEIIRSCKIFDIRKSYRGIPIEFYRSWGCRLLYSEYVRYKPYAIGFPMSDMGKLVGWKCRPLSYKGFYSLGNTSSTDPFGFERALKLGGDIMWFTEGEYDAIALDYCMTLVGNRRMYPVVSLTHGGGSLTKNMKKIRSRLEKGKYRILVFVLDDDEVGHLAEDVAKNIWSKCAIINKPNGTKDANDAVKNGFEVEMGLLALGR